MIKIENVEIFGWGAAMRGMRNPKNSWNRTDSKFENGEFIMGENDHKLAMTLAKSGSDDRKFMRMIHVQMDVTAPLYWWKEADKYQVGTVTDSCSTMHKIHDKKFTLDDFSHEHLIVRHDVNEIDMVAWLQKQIDILNEWRLTYLDVKDSPISASSAKEYWWQLIQLLPSSYNQKRTFDLNYEVLKNMYHARKFHKLDEWREFCGWIESLPYSELITEVKA